MSSVSPPTHIKERGRGRGTTLFSWCSPQTLSMPSCRHDSYKITKSMVKLEGKATPVPSSAKALSPLPLSKYL